MKSTELMKQLQDLSVTLLTPNLLLPSKTCHKNAALLLDLALTSPTCSICLVNTIASLYDNDTVELVVGFICQILNIMVNTAVKANGTSLVFVNNRSNS